MELIILLLIGTFIAAYRINNGQNVYQFVTRSVSKVYNKYAPYSFKMVREKSKELGKEYIVNLYLNKFKLIQLTLLWNLIQLSLLLNL